MPIPPPRFPAGKVRPDFLSQYINQLRDYVYSLRPANSIDMYTEHSATGVSQRPVATVTQKAGDSSITLARVISEEQTTLHCNLIGVDGVVDPV